MIAKTKVAIGFLYRMSSKGTIPESHAQRKARTTLPEIIPLRIRFIQIAGLPEFLSCVPTCGLRKGLPSTICPQSPESTPSSRTANHDQGFYQSVKSPNGQKLLSETTGKQKLWPQGENFWNLLQQKRTECLSTTQTFATENFSQRPDKTEMLHVKWQPSTRMPTKLINRLPIFV